MIKSDFIKLYEELSNLNENNSKYANVGYNVSNIGGFQDGNIIKATAATGSLYDYLNIEKTKLKNPALSEVNPKEWDPFKYAFTFVYNCSDCKALLQYTGKSFTKFAKNHNGVIKDLIKCRTCSHRVKNTIANNDKVWDCIPDWFFINKFDKEDSILSEKGFKVLKLLNKEKEGYILGRKVANFDEFYNMSYEEYLDSKLKIVYWLTPTCQLNLPFVCPECKNVYVTKIVNLFKHRFGMTDNTTSNFGCDKCIASLKGGQTSQSELFLKTAIKTVFGKTNIIEDPTKSYIIYPYQKVDILFKYKNNTIAIEYDGRGYHQEKNVKVDINKVDIYKDKFKINKFIRVRESGCAAYTSNNADIIEIKAPFINLMPIPFIECIKAICKFIEYTLTDENKADLKQLWESTQSTLNIQQQKQWDDILELNQPVDIK